MSFVKSKKSSDWQSKKNSERQSDSIPANTMQYVFTDREVAGECKDGYVLDHHMLGDNI